MSNSHNSRLTVFFKKTLHMLASPHILFLSLPALMILLFAGTLAQGHVGLHLAHQTYFASFITFIGPIPFPGAYTLLILLAINLLVKFIFFTQWRFDKIGSILSHLGILILLFGGALTALTSEEGYLTVSQNNTSNIIHDYHQRQLVIYENNAPLLAIPHQQLKSGMAIKSNNLPFTISINTYCYNCAITRRPEITDTDNQLWHSPAQFMQLNNQKKREKNDEENLTGVEFTISNADKKSNGNYITFDGFPKPPKFKLNNNEYTITIERAQRTLPFSIYLDKFKRTNHPGTSMASAYQSTITVKDGSIEWPAVIEMNQPLRYKGYTLFQSSFDETGDHPTTILAVVHNKGQIFPYISSIILALGLIIHLAIRMKQKNTGHKKNILLAILLASLLQLPASAHATTTDKETQINQTHFARIAILHEGRLKPLDSFARIHLKQFSGKDSFQQHNATYWLAETIFNPSSAMNMRIFKIRQPELISILSLKTTNDNLYSYTELLPGLDQTAKQIPQLLDQPQDQLNPDQKNLLTLHENILTYMQILRAMSLILPLNIDENSRNNTTTFLDLYKSNEKLRDDIKKIMQKKGSDIKKFNDQELKKAKLSYQIQIMMNGGENNNYFRVVPSSWNKKEWFALWDLTLNGHGSPETAKTIALWQEMAFAYRTHNGALWNKTTQIASIIGGEQTALNTRIIEIYYNKINPFLLATFISTFSFFILLAFSSIPAHLANRISKIVLNAAFILLSSSALIQLLGIGIRIMLAARPPVGTLYESILFVSLISICVGLLVSKKDKIAGLYIASLSSGFLGFLGQGFAGEGDNIQMLSAVLNTNFWLATHVLCITIGYGWCIITSIYAHISLIKDTRTAEATQPEHQNMLHILGITSLLFTAIGTILGGIWADQSWGRFWGWDPKENGALLIVLWLSWIIHASISQHLNAIWVKACYAGLSIMVAIAWIGVNLLGVGLHSYGFTEAAFSGLIIFIITEISIIGFLIQRANKQKKIS